MRGRPGRRCLALGFAALMALSPLTPTYGRTHQVRAGSVTQHRAARAARTAVTVVVRNCPECTVQAVHYVPAEGSPWWSHAQRVGSRGRVRFHVPARRTEGMTFFVDAPWHGSTGSAALMVARYDDLATGSRVDHTTARRARHGAPCWAGTTGARARLVLRVERFRARTVTGQRSFHPRVYSVRTLASWPPSDLTWKGSVGAQDAFACARPTVVPRAPAAHGQGTTTLTLRTDRCEGCLVRIGQWTDVNRPPWLSSTRRVRHGRVTFSLSTAHTHGLEIAVTAPWEDQTGYQTFVVARYAGHRPGSRIGFAAARKQQQGSVCWAGTDAHRATLRMAVRRVKVRAHVSGQQVDGTLAWLPMQRRTWPPMRVVSEGVYGSEEATVCQPR